MPLRAGLEPLGVWCTRTRRQGDQDLIGTSPPMEVLRTLIHRFAPYDVPILIQGEEGTGKRLVAEVIHSLSPYRDGVFVALDCGALAEGLLGIELFGSGPGLSARCPQGLSGILEQTAGGTVCLEHIERMPDWMVSRLVRTLKTHTLERLGEPTGRPVQARMIVARTMKQGPVTARGMHRDILLDCLCGGFPLTLPPLRERGGDVVLLSRHFLDCANRECGTWVRGFSPAAQALLEAHDWPGNLLELQTVIRAAALAAGQLITPAHFPMTLGGGARSRAQKERR